MSESLASPSVAVPPPSSAGERLHALDALRATAMFLGIVLHGLVSFTVSIAAPWPVHDPQTHVGFDLVIAVIHGFRMPLFFLIAGFFAHLLWARSGTRAFIAQRWRRIGVPFLLAMCTIMPLSVIVVIAFAHGTHPPTPPTRGPPTMHLWFLEMLLALYAIVMVFAWASKRWNGAPLAGHLDRAFAALMRRRVRVLLLAVPTAVLLWNGPSWGEIDELGSGLLIAPRAIVHFGLFFAVGWWLHRRIELLERIGGWPEIVVGAVAFVSWLACMSLRLAPGDPRYDLFKAVALYSSALYAWTMTLGLTGLFLRLAHAARPWVRYLADASYWCYVAHLPLVFALQFWAARLELPAALKALIVIGTATALLLASYEWLVRYTWIGAMLNGPRRRGGSKIALPP